MSPWGPGALFWSEEPPFGAGNTLLSQGLLMEPRLWAEVT